MLTGRFRASYAHVFEPQVPQGGGDPKYSITLLIPKSDISTLNAIQAEMSRALQEGVSKVFNGQMPARPKLPLYDGDGTRANGEPFGEECSGCMVITASSKTRPSVVDLNMQPIIDPNGFYSGCYARATINFFAYNQSGNKGVGCALNNVQKLEDGEPLSGRSTADEDFGGRNAWNGPATYSLPVRGTAQPGSGQPSYQAPVQQSGYQQPAAGYGQTGYQPSVQQPAYQAPQQPSYQAPVQQPGYQPPATGYGQPGYPAQGYQQPQIDPITGMPMIPGGVMGI